MHKTQVLFHSVIILDLNELVLEAVYVFTVNIGVTLLDLIGDFGFLNVRIIVKRVILCFRNYESAWLIPLSHISSVSLVFSEYFEVRIILAVLNLFYKLSC